MDPGVLIGFHLNHNKYHDIKYNINKYHNINHLFHYLNHNKYHHIKYNHNKYHNIKYNIYKYHNINTTTSSTKTSGSGETTYCPCDLSQP
jgi:hypothetical protein